MRQHLDTAPIWAAYRADCECPLCRLCAENERAYVAQFLGGSVMEPAVRVEVNQKGFCDRHLRMLFEAGNRLSLALMLDTHLQETIARMRAAEAGLNRPAKTSLFGRGATPPGAAFADCARGCILCERLDDTMARYAATLADLWVKDESFRALFDASKGLCAPHCAQLIRIAGEELPAVRALEFQRETARLTIERLDKLEGDLAWFTQKFDYRNQDKPWGESRDAVERAIRRLRGGDTGVL